jgi:peptidoglycan hydrolase-like protein with peptidoglycan-binding domain
MSTATLAHLPLAAGGAVLSATGHAIHWGFSRYMRAPLANTAILCLVTFSAMAGSNALYMQHGEHPNPMFAPAGRASIAPQVIEPVVPATRSKKPLTLAPLPTETTGSVAADAPLGNAEVSEIQQKLTSMQIFDGKIDGLYGPRTARAIKAFETRMGLPPKGELSRELLEAVRAAPVILPDKKATPQAVAPKAEAAPQTAIEPEPTVTPLAVVEAPPAPAAPVPSKAAAAAEAALAPLPAPAPLEMPADEPVVTAELPSQPVLRRELPATPEEAMEIAVQTAGEAIDTIVAGVQSVAMTTPPRKKQVEPVEFVAEQPAATATIAAEPELETASIASPQVGVPLAVEEEVDTMTSENIPELDTDARVEDLMAPFSVTDPAIVAKVQRGLGSLGFLHGPADGVAGEATAKAIRNFEVYYNYKVTGRISPELLDLLVQNGASI